MMLKDLTYVNSRYLAFVLDDACKAHLLKVCPPNFEKVYCDHVTIALSPSEETFEKIKRRWNTEPDVEALLIVIGDDIEALVCTVDKDSQRLFAHDKGTYHVTMSLNPPRKPANSKELISKSVGVKRIPFKDPIKLTGKFKFVV